jgi:predicted metal-dependent hydrolase
MPSNPTSSTLTIGDVVASVTRKRIKHINLRIAGPQAQLLITAPLRMTLENIRAFAVSKMGWIVKHQTRIRRAPHSVKDSTVKNPDVMMLWGTPHPIVIVQGRGVSRVRLTQGEVRVHLRPSSPSHKKRALLDAWQRNVLLTAIRHVLNKWEPLMGVEVARVTVQRMSTRWGSCTPSRRRICLNLELLSRSPEYLEYVVVHELAHFFERGHGSGFKRAMDRFLPEWRRLRRELNHVPP